MCVSLCTLVPGVRTGWTLPNCTAPEPVGTLLDLWLSVEGTPGRKRLPPGRTSTPETNESRRESTGSRLTWGPTFHIRRPVGCSSSGGRWGVSDGGAGRLKNLLEVPKGLPFPVHLPRSPPAFSSPLGVRPSFLLGTVEGRGIPP